MMTKAVRSASSRDASFPDRLATLPKRARSYALDRRKRWHDVDGFALCFTPSAYKSGRFRLGEASVASPLLITHCRVRLVTLRYIRFLNSMRTSLPPSRPTLMASPTAAPALGV